MNCTGGSSAPWIRRICSIRGSFCEGFFGGIGFQPMTRVDHRQDADATFGSCIPAVISVGGLRQPVSPSLG